MDVMRPQLLRIGNICYRKNPIDKKLFVDTDNEDFHHEWQEECDENELNTDYAANEDESCMMDCNVEKTSSGYSLSISLPSATFKYIIGKKGETKKRLEFETQTRITIPRQGEEGNGKERNKVLSANTRIGVLVESARKYMPFTHFISFPIIGEENIRNGFEDFKKDVLENSDPADGVDSTIFQNVYKLHLTVGMLTLLDAREIQTAAQLLDSSRQLLIDEILRGEPLELDIQGLEYMNDDPDEVDVLYATVFPVDGSQRLQRLADRLVDIFVSARLMRREYDKVKLHVTVMNTRLRKDKTGGAGGKGTTGVNTRYMDRESFCASGILEHYRDYSFGQYHLRAIHLSQRDFTGADGYYAPAGIIQLP